MEYVFRLYIYGKTKSSTYAVRNLKKIIGHLDKTEYTLEIVDILERPNMAYENSILATPTLVKLKPEPVAKLIGDLSDTDIVCTFLNLNKGFGK